MRDSKSVPYMGLIIATSSVLLFLPLFQVRAALGPLSLVRDIDLLLAVLFFAVCCALVGRYERQALFLSTAPLGLGIVLVADSQFLNVLTSEQGVELGNAFIVGVALFLLSLFLTVRTSQIFEVFSDKTAIFENRKSLLSQRPYLALFIITVTILFLEIVLIRYSASQIRIFSFYKNIPLIAAFLGLGLGCFRSKGRKAHLLLFFLLLAPTLAILSQVALFFDEKMSRMAAVASTEFIIGDALVVASDFWTQMAAQAYTMIFIVLIFLSIGALFSYLGRFLGDALEQVARLRGYSVDICGSLLGILIFTALGYAWAPPVAWIGLGLVGLAAVVPRQREMLNLLPMAVFCVFTVWPSVGETIWSPYQKIIGQKVHDGFNLDISDVYYQRARYFRPYAEVTEDEIKNSRHYLTFWKRQNLGRVLIVGAGSGNDTAVALLAGAKSIDAVEIDPAIVAFGRRYHPNQPYSDPRVRVIVNDARKAFRELESRSYDIAVFGALDAHTQLGHSSVRLDNYVFTVESIREASRLVKPGGWVVISAVAPTEWLQQRFVNLLKAGCGEQLEWKIFARQSIHATCKVEGASAGAGVSSAKAPTQGRVLPVDDWPFLYLPSPDVPLAYAIAILLLTIVSVLFLKRGGLDVRLVGFFRGHMFFLGAGFLLMEVYAINRLALLYGTTWIVSAVAIGLVLALIVLANATTALVRRDLRWSAYIGLFGSLVASYSLDMSTALDHGIVATGLVSLVIVSPVYFAGVIFAKSYAIANVAGASIGANILGAVLGGWLEYVTMATGIRSMTLFAAALYGLSLFCLEAHRRRSPALA